jgi:hypothetical protein
MIQLDATGEPGLSGLPGQSELRSTPGRFFNRHNFTNYAESRFGSLLVTNDFGIIGGRDQEGDESYRYRIHLKLISQSGSNESSLRFAPFFRFPAFKM